MSGRRTLLRRGRVRIQWTPNWRSKPSPWFFKANYPSGGGTRQVAGLELWWCGSDPLPDTSRS